MTKKTGDLYKINFTEENRAVLERLTARLIFTSFNNYSSGLTLLFLKANKKSSSHLKLYMNKSQKF